MDEIVNAPNSEHPFKKIRDKLTEKEKNQRAKDFLEIVPYCMTTLFFFLFGLSLVNLVAATGVKATWLSHFQKCLTDTLAAAPNNSFNRSGSSTALIRKVEGLFHYMRARFIRALGVLLP